MARELRALPLSYGATSAISAGGTRTHVHEVMTLYSEPAVDPVSWLMTSHTTTKGWPEAFPYGN